MEAATAQAVRPSVSLGKMPAQTQNAPAALTRPGAGHGGSSSMPIENLPNEQEGPNPSGLCMCGCGGKTALATATDLSKPKVKGKPQRFLPGHWARVGQERPALERFREKVDRGSPDECWEWTGYRPADGYGRFKRDKGAPVLAHRTAWEYAHGPIPEGLHVCHHCDNPPCCNPAHLFLGTDADNCADKVRKGRLPRGEQAGQAKLTEAAVREIRALWETGNHTQGAIGRRFGVSAEAVGHVVRRSTWRHVA